jgi:hypothetical protein
MPFQSELMSLVEKWGKDHEGKKFPAFDSRVTAPPHTLVLLESPGPEARESGVVSAFNNDETARELKRLIEIAFDGKAQAGVLCWNAIPWFLSRPPLVSDIGDAKDLHDELLALVRPGLQYVVLLGTMARYLLPFCSTRVGSAHIYGGHHTSRQAQLQRHSVQENEAVFRLLKNRC